MSVRKVLIVGASVAVVLAMFIITLILLNISASALREVKQVSFLRSANTVSESIATSVRFKKVDLVAEKLEPFLLENANAIVYVSVFLADGELLFSSNEAKAGEFPLATVPDSLQTTESMVSTSRSLTLITPLRAGRDQNLVGFVVTGWNFSEVQRVSQTMLKSALLIGSVILLLTLLVIYFLVHRLISVPFANFSRMTAQLASGDCNLSQRINYQSNNEFGMMSRHINQFIEKLESSMTTIQKNSSQVSTVSNQMEHRIADLESKVSHQREDIKQSVGIGEQLKESIDLVKERMTKGSGALKQAVESANTGQEKLAHAMQLNQDLSTQTEQGHKVASQLSEQTDKVTTILEIIRNIAEQTNLLALNAAIEAARAGESGRGFAVVADEVRSLAEKTSNSTDQVEEILVYLNQYSDELVKTMQQGLENSRSCVESLALTEQQIHDIIEKVNDSNTVNSEVVSTSNSQFDSMGMLIRLLRQLDDQVDHLFADSQDMTQYSKNLHDSAEATQSNLKAFNLDER